VTARNGWGSLSNAGTEVKRLEGKEIALIFEKTSTRTRSAFEVAAYDQGAHVTYMDPTGSQMGHKESIADTARVLGRMYDGIEFRGAAHSEIEELAAYAGVPVYNGLTDDWHPTQMLADMLTIREQPPKAFDEVALCYTGDGRNNVARSLLVTGALLGMDVRIAAPRALAPDEEALGHARRIAAETGARITVTDDASVAVTGVDFLYTDVWVSMGEPDQVWDERIRLLRTYQVNQALLTRTGNPQVQFLHCLPSIHNRQTVIGERIYQSHGLDGVEVTDEVFSSPASIVFDQAENRMHTIKAVMVATMSG
jgi:ornithine carbamoyltransferase